MTALSVGWAAELWRRNVEAADKESDRLSIDLRLRSQAWLARTLGALGAFAEGQRHGEEAISEGIRTGGLHDHAQRVAWLSEGCRLAGHGEEAWQHACQALDLARQHKDRRNEAHALVAHCHRGLGTLYATIGQKEQARIELSAAIALYGGMDMTFWLPQTEAALAQVERG